MIIFLDIDGVLNRHEQLPNGYCGTTKECVEAFNFLLVAYPDARIYISSAWRYLVLNGSMTIKGLEALLQSHGVDCHNRIIGVTEKDPDNGDPIENGLRWRKEQIEKVVTENNYTNYIVIDDLKLDVKNFFQTNPNIGLTYEIVSEIIENIELKMKDIPEYFQKQTITHCEDGQVGNCWQTCVAILTRNKIEDVPHFCEDNSWPLNFYKWLDDNGLSVVEFKDHKASLDFRSEQWGYHIITGESPRKKGRLHAVIGYNGDIVFDPHPDDTGLVPGEWSFTFIFKKV